VHLAQGGAGVDAELVAQQAGGLAEGLQRVGLPAGAVEGVHLQLAQPFAQRVGGGQGG
jgi:hypothetical protein